MCDASIVSPGRGGIVPCSVGSLSRSHGTMCTTTLTFARACRRGRRRVALEDVRVELERRLPRVPPARREAGAEVDHRVERDLLATERIDDAEHLRVVFERPVRLHVAERPPRRHRRGPGDRREVLQRLRRLGGVEDEDVVQPRDDGVRRRQALCQRLLLVALVLRHAFGVAGFPRHEDAAVGFAEIDLPPRRRDEQAPAARAEQHRDRVARAVHVGLPARLHRVEPSAPIELHRLLAPRPALAPAAARLRPGRARGARRA